MQILEYVLPAAWASYLINRDESGYSAAELALIKEWERDARVGEALSCGEDTYFTRYSDVATALEFQLIECTQFQFTN